MQKKDYYTGSEKQLRKSLRENCHCLHLPTVYIKFLLYLEKLKNMALSKMQHPPYYVSKTLISRSAITTPDLLSSPFQSLLQNVVI